MITLDTTNDWNLVDVDNISGRLNVMWLTPDGVGISTREIFSYDNIEYDL